MSYTLLTAILAATSIVTMVAATTSPSSSADDQAIVAALDTQFQLAVKHNDAETMDRILHEDYYLVLGDGRIETRKELLDLARGKTIVFEQQDEETQRVRVFGDVAIVTAKLWLKGTRNGVAFDRKLWFSDTYVRTANGWKYLFGQASLPLPPV